MRNALIASLFLALAGCAGATVRSPSAAQTYHQNAMGATPIADVGPHFGTYPTAYGPKDMGAAPSYTLADVR
jgi:hypothetical protein